MQGKGFASFAIAVFAVTCAHGARAQGRRLLVRYDVAPGCPEVAEFANKLTDRAGPLRIEPAGEGPADIEVAVREDGGTFRGAIEVAARDGRQRRAIDDDDCADLVSALALSASFMLDPSAAPATRRRETAPAPA